MKYFGGVEIKKGDNVVINTSGSKQPGVVINIIEPGTEDAETWSLPNGGVLIEGGGLGLFSTDYIEHDEDIEFVRRESD